MSSNGNSPPKLQNHQSRRKSIDAEDGGSDACAIDESTREVVRNYSISIVESVTSFLEANGAANIEQGVVRSMAEALSKRLNDTSPGTLKDVTMDNSYGVGYRSPCVSLQQYQGSTSPAGQGRSVREFEEQMATLRKENFNLKLRLYFIEESLPGYQQASSQDGQETIVKQLIDTKVEMEILRKEIQEKQEILKEAAQAMNQMEKIQKETEAKSQAMVDELKHKIEYLEMERDMDKSHNGVFMNDLLGRSEISSENLNALQRIRELEGIVTQSEEKIIDFQNQITKLDEILSKRDETIKEYEEKVKEIVFQNAEILEALENKEREVANAERILRGLRMSNADLKEDNRNLIDALKSTQENFRKEVTNIKLCERQMREQQDALSKMQSTISIKTANTARLLERIQEYEKMVTKMNFERNLTKRENRFFRAIIGKLQRNKNECYTIEKEEIYEQIGAEYEEKPIDRTNKHYSDNNNNNNNNINNSNHKNNHYNNNNYHNNHQNYRELKARGDYHGEYHEEYHGEYKLKQKFCVNFCNSSKYSTSAATATMASERCGGCSSGGIGVGMNEIADGISNSDDIITEADYMHDCCDLDSEFEPVEIPIRYTFSDGSLFAPGNSTANSCSSLHANFSSSSLFAAAAAGNQKESLELLQEVSAKRLRKELQKHKSELADKICMLQESEEQSADKAEKLRALTQTYEQARRSIQKLVLNSKNQQDEINRLKNLNSTTLGSNASNANKENTNGNSAALSGLECTGICRSFGDAAALTEIGDDQRQKFETIIAQQEATIKDLKAEVKKKTSNLQNLVNKELWEKNREIERLTKMANNKSFNSLNNTSGDQAAIANELQQSFSDVEYARAVERNKLLQRKVDILIQRLGSDRNNETLLAQLRNDVREARTDADNAEKWRQECVDVCSILSNRLEELAGFLNSLLKHKDVLGVLAADRRRAMRKAVDRSLDLSKSLNMTLSGGSFAQHDRSLAQLSNLSEILGGADGIFDDVADEIEAEGPHRTFNSHEELRSLQPNNSIDALKAENKALKKELDKRRSFVDPKKDRRSLPLPLPTVTTSLLADQQSESEAWSEPDRKVSMARIGLEDRSGASAAKELTPAVSGAAVPHDTDSEESGNPNQSRNNASTKVSTRERTHERIVQLEQQITQRDERILDIQCKLVEADNRLKREHLRVIDLTQELTQLRERNEELHADLIEIGSGENSAELISVGPTPTVEHNASTLLLLNHQIEEKTRTVERLQEERDRLAVEARFAEMQIGTLKTDMDTMRAQHAQALAAAAEQEHDKLNQLQRDMTTLSQQRLAESERIHEETLSREYVTRTFYEECTEQLLSLQRQHIDAMRTIDFLGETETELKRSLVDSEVAARSLRKQLDDTTLQASRAVLERTKAHNDRINAEKRCADLTQRLQVAESERQALQREVVQLQRVQVVLEQQITASQQRQQQQQQQQQQQLNNGSSDCASGYTSEEIPLQLNTVASAVTAAPVVAGVEAQRLYNPSPDLGIESDVGRVSSVDTSGGIGATPAIHNDQLNLSSIGADIKKEDDEEEQDENTKPSNRQQQLQLGTVQHDCAKVELENAELRRKLIRNKRAFEDFLERLRVSNQRKAAQVEKDIKNQLLKTHNVLKEASSNLEKNDL